MANHPGFGVALTRLMNHRRTDVARLSSASGVPEAELRAVVSGTSPSTPQLDRLASALGFHLADFCVIADALVPEPLTPRDPAAGTAVVDLVRIAMALPSDGRAHVHRLVDELPPEHDERQSAPSPLYDQREAGFGAMLANLLCTNRNLHSLTAAAKTLAVLTEGRVYLAASTISGIGRGRVPLTPDLVAGFATALGIPRGDLAASRGSNSPSHRGPTIRWRRKWRGCCGAADA
ncbi:helix-turn-helix domain-containing protein [Streptomyces sp. NPDC001663]|uniref:helix-turn-helix domain-containing protein n=1 Tax=Streptomyces sp. NPDC001663 TaxID=3364597 RepID=UPI0036D026D5